MFEYEPKEASMTLLIEASKNPSFEDIDFLTRGIYEEAKKKRGMRPNESFCFFLKDEHGKTVGGINGFCYYGCLYIDQLFIEEAHRGHGWGKKLVKAAEDFGHEQKCRMFTVTTMDWEAREFYEELGYSHVFTISGYENDATMHLLRKDRPI